MKISYQWLLNYLPEPLPVDELSEILTRIGLEVEHIGKIEKYPGGLKGLVVGQVLSCEKHPDADKLKYTQVDIGAGEPLSIVCGAPNVATGQKIMVATVGTTLYPIGSEPFTIKKAKIRGLKSEGMICAEDEMGIGESHEGILVLPAETPVGQTAAEFFKVPEAEVVLEIGLTPNRSDANSHLGVARDVCAYLSHHRGSRVTPVFPELPFSPGPQEDLPFKIQVKDPKACPRYAGMTIKGVQVGPSPEWLQNRLKAIGIGPVNNIVDVTNFVLHEYGQPLHAFDYAAIDGAHLIIDRAAAGQVFTTLDNVERKLDPADLMINNANGPMCIAGVFGGLHSGISASTSDVFLESAYFDPATIRRTTLRHGLRTEAATHFEKGVAIEQVIPALQRAALLILEIAGGVPGAITDYYPEPFPRRSIYLSWDYLFRICGKTYDRPAVARLLETLGFKISTQSDAGLEVEVASERQDMHQAADLAEEVLRIDGLDQIDIPAHLHIALPATSPVMGKRAQKERIAQYLADTGFRELVTNSISNSKYYPDVEQLVRLVNSLSSELDVMRPRMLESGLEVLQYNLNRKMDNLRLFEIGHVFQREAAGKYTQQNKVAFWLTGAVSEKSWNRKAEAVDIYYLKGVVASVLRLVGVNRPKESVDTSGALKWTLGKNELAMVTEVLPALLKQFGIKQTVYYGEIDLDQLLSLSGNAALRYKEIPKYPGMQRDLALVVSKDINYEQIAAIAHKQKWTALQSFELFDLFEHEKIGPDKKSLALSFTFQLNDRTLTDGEVDKMMEDLIRMYEKELQATVRT